MRRTAPHHATRHAGLLALGCAAFLAAPGCVWGLRGGPEVIASSSGSALVQGTITGVVGLGSTSRWQPRTSSDGLLFTSTFSAGGDPQLGATFSGAGGIGWFDVPEERRVGWTAGVEAGGRWRARGPDGAQAIAGLRGGPLFRLLSRADGGGRLVTLGVDLTVGAALSADGPSDEASFTAGVAVTLGMWDVNVFHM